MAKQFGFEFMRIYYKKWAVEKGKDGNKDQTYLSGYNFTF